MKCHVPSERSLRSFFRVWTRQRLSQWDVGRSEVSRARAHNAARADIRVEPGEGRTMDQQAKRESSAVLYPAAARCRDAEMDAWTTSNLSRLCSFSTVSSSPVARPSPTESSPGSASRSCPSCSPTKTLHGPGNRPVSTTMKGHRGRESASSGAVRPHAAAWQGESC